MTMNSIDRINRRSLVAKAFLFSASAFFASVFLASASAMAPDVRVLSSAQGASARDVERRGPGLVLPPAIEHEQYRPVGPRHISADTLGTPADRLDATDLDVTLIERTPRYNYDAAKNNPYIGDTVAFSGHIKNWGNSALPSVEYRWQIDGSTVASGTVTNLSAGEERIVTRLWVWQAGDHWVKFTADPNNLISELSEANNEIEDRTNAIIAGFWVEQSAYDYFHQYQNDLGIGSNSWPDWIQRQMRTQNELYAEAVWPISPQGVLDRVRIDKIVVVPDGALPLHGGLPTNHPDLSDKTVDLMWGFPANQIPPQSTFYADHTNLSEANPFYIEQSLIHELGHARYLIDSYGFDVHNTADHGGYDAVQIWEGSVYVGGSVYMPYLAFDEVLHYNGNGGVMSGPYGFHWSPYEAAALNLIAGQRAVCGNYNASCNLGVYLQDLPQNNHIRFVNGSGQPRAVANVRIYRAEAGPGWYGKTFDNTYDAEYGTDVDGYAHLPQNPFTSGGPIDHTYGIANSDMILRIEHAGLIWYRFVEAADFNMQYWQGNTQDAYYTIVLDDPPGVGACCAGDGTCTSTAQDGCLAPAIWQGMGTTCGPNPCPPPGACCEPLGLCTLVPASSCLQPSVWQGAATTCDPNPCPISVPILRSVADVPNDQGRQVRLRWCRAHYDAPGQPVTITGYAIFREQGQNKAETPATSPVRASDAPVRTDLRAEGWDYILTVPALGDTAYQCVAPTLCDSTISSGLCLSTFMIRAMTPSPFTYYDSAPASGYSIDNLAPAAPANLRFPSPSVLAWNETVAPDLDFYSVYGSSGPVFDSRTAVLIGHTTTTGMDVAGSRRPYLHVTATDFAGNEGHAAGIQNMTSGTDGGTFVPARFALYPCQPNPTAGTTVIRFDLPRESDVSLRLFDVAGREVAVLAHGRYAAGRHETRLDSEVLRRLRGGVYLYRLEAGLFSETRKVQVIGR